MVQAIIHCHVLVLTHASFTNVLVSIHSMDVRTIPVPAGHRIDDVWELYVYSHFDLIPPLFVLFLPLLSSLYSPNILHHLRFNFSPTVALSAFGIDDPSHSNDLAELLLSVFNGTKRGTKRANITRGSNKPQSSPIISANFSLQDKAARCVVCVDKPKVHAIYVLYL